MENRDNEIIEYFKKHKLSGTGIRNFLQYYDKDNTIREYLDNQLQLHPEYHSYGGYINCLVNNIKLPKCKMCENTVSYKQYINKRIYCSRECFKKDSDTVANHFKETCMKRYGVSNPSQVDSIKEKRYETNIKRFGVKYLHQNKEIVKKAKATMMKKYGVDSYLKTDEHKRKAYKQSYKTILSWKDYVIPLFTFDEYNGKEHNEVYKWKCVKCGNEFESRIYETSHCKEFQKLPRCWKCYPECDKFSFVEKEILDFIKLIYNGEILNNIRNIITPYELDIYLPEKKFAIEFDGLFWHNENSNKDKNYHLMKTELCEKQGIQLIHIFEDEWLHKQEIVKDRIKSILGIDRIRIFARKCIVKEILSKQSNNFLDINHIQGGDNSKYHYGLYYNDELVAVMTFGKPRFNKNYDYELIRFASKIGYQVIGGAGKLLKYFENKFPDNTIISYADKRYSNGKLYKALGFESIGNSDLNYWWCKNKVKLSRYQCQKHKLKKLLGEENFNENLSESENMHFNGWSKIYDCGNIIFVKNLKNYLLF